MEYYDIDSIRNKIIRGHVLDVLKKFPSSSIDMVITSPPYWSLRDYGIEPVVWDGDPSCDHQWGDKITVPRHKKGETNPGKEAWYKEAGAINNEAGCFCVKCGAWKGQLGLEPDFNLYLDHLIVIFREVKRILKKEGTLWVNIGDTYGSGRFTVFGDKVLSAKNKLLRDTSEIKRGKIPGYEKSLLLIPFRFAIRMIDELGFKLRNVVIWHKPTCLPESVKDRFTNDFEYLFFFTKNKKYYFEQQFESLKSNTLYKIKNDIKLLKERGNLGRKTISSVGSFGLNTGKSMVSTFETISTFGRNMRAVWSISTEPYPEAHFAVFPSKLIETPIKAGCPEFVCKKCGMAKRKVACKEYVSIQKTKDKNSRYGKKAPSFVNPGCGAYEYGRARVKINGFREISCDCEAGFNPGIVLDPFIGSGTTALVAKKLGRDFIGIEIKKEYIEMAWRRLEKAGLKNQKRLDDFGWKVN